MKKHCLNCNQKPYENTHNLNESEVLKNKEEQPSAYDNFNKNKINKFALIGFILSLIEPVFIIFAILPFDFFYKYTEIIWGYSPVILGASLIFSVIGLILCIIKKQRGKGLAIAGIVFSGGIILFVFIALAFLMQLLEAIGNMG